MRAHPVPLTPRPETLLALKPSSPLSTPHPILSLFLLLLPSAHPLQRRKQELSQDDAILRDTLQAARETLARASELLQGMDRAKEVGTAPWGCALGRVGGSSMSRAWPLGSQVSGKGVGTGRDPPSPSSPRSTSAWPPAWTEPGRHCWRRSAPSPPSTAGWSWWRLPRPMRSSWTSWRTTSPGAGPVEGAQRAWPGLSGTPLVGGVLEGGAIVPTGRPHSGLRVSGPPPTHAWPLPCSPRHSIIRGVNQDRFIQRAIEAANAYSSILRAVQAAEGAAGQALQQASSAWEVGPRLPLGRRSPVLPALLPLHGCDLCVTCNLCPVCRWWSSRAWLPRPGGCGPTAVPWRRPFSGSSGGWATVSAACAWLSVSTAGTPGFGRGPGMVDRPRSGDMGQAAGVCCRPGSRAVCRGASRQRGGPTATGLTASGLAFLSLRGFISTMGVVTVIVNQERPGHSSACPWAEDPRV